MKIIIRLAGLFMFVASVALANSTDWPKARVTIGVVGEDGVAISNATVHIGFSQGGNAWTGEHVGEVYHGQSNVNGYFSAEAKSEMSVGGSVEKEGYYRSFWGHTFDGNSQELDRWQPWNPTNIVVLRKVGNPVPMYAKRVETLIPLLNVPIGFDLEKGDWVVPHGKGISSDFTFLFRGRFVCARDRDEALQVNFSGPSDGIQSIAVSPMYGSQLRLSSEAPSEGYINLWVREKTMHPGSLRQNQRVRLDQNYIFRVRAVVDGQGRLKEAMYGKIHGDFDFGYVDADKVLLAFTYYLNPDGTRNLEFNPSQNLFPDLKSTEQVKDP